jgi:hypothetical protein
MHACKTFRKTKKKKKCVAECPNLDEKTFLISDELNLVLECTSYLCCRWFFIFDICDNRNKSKLKMKKEKHKKQEIRGNKKYEEQRSAIYYKNFGVKCNCALSEVNNGRH